MELRHIRSFLVLSEKLHFSQSAAELFIVQPALTKQIKELEENLGVKLFERNKRNVSLTVEGIYFKEKCQTIMSIIEDTKKEIKWISDGNKGEIKIGYVGSCIHTFLPGVLEKIASNFPNIHWYLNEMTSIAQETAIRENALDIAFLRNPEETIEYESKIIFKEPFALVIPSSHTITAENFKSINQFKDEKFILPTKSDGRLYYQLQQSICIDAGFLPTIAHESVHGHTVLKMVEHQFGVTLLPLSFLQFSNEKVRFIPLLNIPQRSEISILWKKNNKNPCLTKVLNLL